MFRNHRLQIIFLTGAFWLLQSSDFVQAQNATEVVRRADTHARGASSAAEITIKTTRPGF